MPSITLEAAIAELRDCWRCQLVRWASAAWRSDFAILPCACDADLRLWRAIYGLRGASGNTAQYHAAFRRAIRLGRRDYYRDSLEALSRAGARRSFPPAHIVWNSCAYADEHPLSPALATVSLRSG